MWWLRQSSLQMHQHRLEERNQPLSVLLFWGMRLKCYKLFPSKCGHSNNHTMCWSGKGCGSLSGKADAFVLAAQSSRKDGKQDPAPCSAERAPSDAVAAGAGVGGGLCWEHRKSCTRKQKVTDLALPCWKEGPVTGLLGKSKQM